MELDDARRIIATLTSLRIWFEGTSGNLGALDKIESIKSDLDGMLKRLDDLPSLYLKDFKTLLNDTTESALVLQSDLFISEIDKIMGLYSEKLPSQVARVVLKVIQTNNVDKIEHKKLLLKLSSYEKDIENITENNLILKRESSSDKKTIKFLMLLSSTLLLINLSFTLSFFL